MAKFNPNSLRRQASARTFSSALGMKALPAKPGIDAHDKHVIHQIEHLVERRNRRGRIQHHSGQRAVVANQPQRPVQMNAGFLMHQHVVGAGAE